jgi:radical SAM superfamily enzyme YgiQ (UPF0313 family)
MGPMTPTFEQGPIRPPSEARSLLVRVVRNCPWNRCAFCPVYKGTRPSGRKLEEILGDIDAMAEAADVLREMRRPSGADPFAAARAALGAGRVPAEAVQVALFLADGGRGAFLQDADPIAAPPDKLESVLARLRERFGRLERITTYARSATLARRGEADLRRLAEAGLNRIHVGLESGSDEVLARVRKGTTGAEQIEGGRRVLGAGMELCFYFMPGLGGRDLAAAHVAGTARVVRETAAAAVPERPLTVRLRTTAVSAGTPLADMEAAGEYELPDDVATSIEIRDFLLALEDVRVELRSDHSLNLMLDLEGSLPDDRDRLVALVDRFLEMPAAERAEFALGRRIGVYGAPEDAADPRRRAELRRSVQGLDAASPEDLLALAARLRSRCV